ncbi:MAG TPA: hypothetical protein VGS03_07305 [Candidatus Polarisedimenticolia bacterium]|nr:hypothetical protein [Candidatus Polarisedimenticolia bacterium]
MKAIRILAIVAIAALVLAPVATVYAGTDKDKAATSTTGKKQEKVVTVVSVDPDAKTITVRDLGGSAGTGSATTPSTPGSPSGSTGSATASGDEKTLKVTGQAISKLNQVRPGQQITVVFNNDNQMDTISDLKFDTASTGTTPPASH